MELQEIKLHLEETREELLAIVSGLNKEQLSARKDTSSWSISQICQHLMKTEELYSVAIKRGLKSDEDSFIENKPLQFLLDRSNKIDAPDIAKPADIIIGCQEISNGLNQSREKLYEILSAVEDPTLLNRRHFTHPVFKEMTLMEWVRSLYIHEQRHIKQMNEILEGLSK
ncbi:DinB family protein [Paenibacillus taiwanensis]|uniref:DinB family protein n=1 Tax=Paenibacillus taiwanensis TaxID=401638 RepID=UPI00040CA85C|nr:DinB family protein [Paenibacillus taiwanensis]